MKGKLLRLGTRGSALAVRQAELVVQELERLDHELQVEIIELVSVGDKKQGTPAAEIGDKRDWIAGLEEAVMSGEVDFALHSAKDVPIQILKGTTLLPIMPREEALDALVTKVGIQNKCPTDLAELRNGARIGTASLRRSAQLLAHRGDLELQTVRGNLTTRLKKLLDSTEIDGIVVAAAGLIRLQLFQENFSALIPADILLPAVNQGILVAQFDETRSELRRILAAISDREVGYCWETERAVIEVIGADCHSAVGVHAVIQGDEIYVRAQVLSRDGSEVINAHERGLIGGSVKIGSNLGHLLLERGAARLLCVD